MISTCALFDVAKRPVAADERKGRHPRDASAPPTAAGVRLLRPGHAQSSKRAWTSCPLVTAACG